MFGRRARKGDVDDVAAAEPEDEGVTDGGTGSVFSSRESGPWDADEVPESGDRLDVGALMVPRREGMEVRMEVDKTSKLVTGASLQLHGSSLQLQVFAAPRSEGIWDEIRAEIADSVAKKGGSVDDLPGPFGRELLARLPVRLADGRTGYRPTRFIGHDGPRWFLRGVLTGRAAVDPERARELETLFADVVVVRGPEPRVPRDLLPLTLPGRPVAEAMPGATTFDPMRRGPEITEVH